MLIVVDQQFYDAGCRNLQFDDCTTWGAVVEDLYKAEIPSVRYRFRYGLSHSCEVNNLALEGRKPESGITSHLQRNYNSTYFSSGAYDSVADYVFAERNVKMRCYSSMMMSVQRKLRRRKGSS